MRVFRAVWRFVENLPSAGRLLEVAGLCVRVAGRSAKKGLAKGGEFLAEALNYLALPTAVVCLNKALETADPRALALLAAREIAVHGNIVVPGVVAWPFLGGWLLAKGIWEGSVEVRFFVGAGIALLLLANLLNYLRQDLTNSAAKLMLALWLATLGTHLFDIYRIAALPLAWDAVMLDGQNPRGMVLRIVEMLGCVSMLSLWAPLRYNRVAPHIVGPMLAISGKLFRGLILWGTIAVVVAPWVLPQLRHLISEFVRDPETIGKAAHALAAAIIFAPLWWPISKILGQLRLLVGLVHQLLSMQPPLTRQIAPPIARRG